MRAEIDSNIGALAGQFNGASAADAAEAPVTRALRPFNFMRFLKVAC